MRYVFMISGYSKSGKDLLSDYLVTCKGITKYAIATRLKAVVAEQYKFCPQLCHSQSGKAQYIKTQAEKKTVRELLIKHAAEIKSLIGDNVFVSDVVDEVMYQDAVTTLLAQPLQHVVISDWRYAHEHAYVCEKLAVYNNTRIVTIRIDRGLQVPTEPSETQLDNFVCTHTLQNKASIANFYTSIDKVIGNYL